MMTDLKERGVEPPSIKDECSRLAAEEWRQISMQRVDEVFPRGWAWVRTNGELACAGTAFAHLLSLRRSRYLTKRAEKWLSSYPDEPMALAVLAELLQQANPSKPSIKLAKYWLIKLDQTFFRRNKPRTKKTILMDRLDLIGPFLKTALLSQSEQLFKSTANLVKCYPAHEVWTSVFLIRTYSRRNRRIERLTASWIRLNSGNKQLRLLCIPVLTPSDEVNLAAYEWISRGGRRYRYMTCILQDVLLNASKDSEVSLLAIEFCRKWLRNHKTHERTGRMHEVLISTTNSTTDVKTALRWYKSHSHLKGAEQVIAALLGLSYRTDFPLATEIIEEAKRLLRNDETRRSFPRLIGSLISVNRDTDSILWAKECFKKNRLSWILARLLESAPDEESMAMARDSFSDWKNSANEPMMLRAILVAEPTNKKFRRRAFYWLSKNPKNSWSDSLIKVLSRRIVG